MERVANKCSAFASTTLQSSARTKTTPVETKVIFISHKKNKEVLSSGQKRCGEISELEKDSSCSTSTKKPKVEKEVEKYVWHGEKCLSCAALRRIKESNMAQLQHHFKFGYFYSVFYGLIIILRPLIKLPEGINPQSPFLNHEQAKLILISASNQIKSKEKAKLFECVVEMSGQLLGPAETATFNCDDFKKHLETLLEITQFISQQKFKNLNHEQVKELIDDIETYLKPFRHQDQAEETTTTGLRSNTIRMKKWDETFIDLRHSPDDNNFGNNLRDIAEPKLGHECIFFPEKYAYKCHGQK